MEKNTKSLRQGEWGAERARSSCNTPVPSFPAPTTSYAFSLLPSLTLIPPSFPPLFPPQNPYPQSCPGRCCLPRASKPLRSEPCSTPGGYAVLHQARQTRPASPPHCSSTAFEMGEEGRWRLTLCAFCMGEAALRGTALCFLRYWARPHKHRHSHLTVPQIERATALFSAVLGQPQHQPPSQPLNCSRSLISLSPYKRAPFAKLGACLTFCNIGPAPTPPVTAQLRPCCAPAAQPTWPRPGVGEGTGVGCVVCGGGRVLGVGRGGLEGGGGRDVCGVSGLGGKGERGQGRGDGGRGARVEIAQRLHVLGTELTMVGGAKREELGSTHRASPRMCIHLSPC